MHMCISSVLPQKGTIKTPQELFDVYEISFHTDLETHYLLLNPLNSPESESMSDNTILYYFLI